MSVGDVLEREAFERRCRLPASSVRHHRVAQLALAGEVPVDGSLVHAGALGDAADGQRAPVPDREAVQELGARGDDALARLGRALAPHRAVVRGAAVVRLVVGHGVTTGSVSHPRTVDVGESLAPSQVDVPLGEPLQHLFERDAALEPRERGAEAEVGAVPEREVLADLAVDVEAVAVGDSAGRRGSPAPTRNSIDAAFGHRLAVVLDVARARTGRRAAPAARTAAAPRSRSGSSDGSSTSSRRWSGCSASTLPAQPIRRVVVSLPAPAMTVTYVRISLAGEPAGGAGLVLELGVAAAPS